MRNRLPLWVGITIAASLCAAADKKAEALGAPVSAGRAGLRPPVAGLFASGERAQLRTIVGAPGAAVFGEAVGLPREVSRVWASPSGAFAVAAAEGGHPLWSVQLRDGQPVAAVLESIVDPVEVMAFSPDGSAAALFSASTRRLFVVTNLPDQATVRDIDLRSLPGGLVSVALSDNAALIALGSYDGQVGAVDIVAEDGSYESVWTGGSPTFLKFAGAALLLSDSAENRVLQLSRVEQSWAVSQLAGAGDGLEEPGSIEVLSSQKWAVVANRKSESLVWIDLGGGKSRLVELPAVAQTMTALRGHNAVVISTAGPEGHWFLTPGVEEPVLTLISESLVGATRQ